jgi:hexosaminidase
VKRATVGFGLALVGSWILVGGCRAPSGAEPSRRHEISARFAVLDNLLPEGAGFRAVLTLENVGTSSLDGSGWRLFFNFGKAIRAESLPAAVTATHINGDFWVLEPTGEFASVPPGGSLEIPFEAPGWLTKESDAPAGLYFVFVDDEGRPLPPEPVIRMTVAPLETARQTDRGLRERLPAPTPASRYRESELLALLPPAEIGRLVPTPAVIRPGAGLVRVDSSWPIRYQAGLVREAAALADILGRLLGERPAIEEIVENAPGRAIVLETGAVPASAGAFEAEAYRLSIDEPGIRIVGSDPAGVFYGTRTLAALAPVAAWREPLEVLEFDQVTIEDAPRFAYRGIHLDVARNFQTKETVERLIEVASFYKLNRFHFHLSDDEGWRLPVEQLPELVAVGGRRGHTEDESDRLVPSFGSGPDPEASNGSGHYSRADMVEILGYARDRHMRVIPEIDLPGHARAAVKAMASRANRLAAEGRSAEGAEFRLTDPEDVSSYRSIQGWDDNVVDVCLDSTYQFVETVIDDIVEIWAEAEAPLAMVHIGGDEVPAGVWAGSPACRRLIAETPELEGPEDLMRHFLSRVSAMLAQRGLRTAGWEEIALTEETHEGGTVRAPDPTLVARGLRPYVWNNVWGWGAEDLGYRLANTGYEVVLSGATHLYFDLAYDRDPREPGYAWAGFVDTRKPWELVPFDIFATAERDLMGHPLNAADFADRVRPTAAGRTRILGIQGQLWGENLTGRDALEYMAFPKLLGLAERAWARDPAWAMIDDAADRRRAREAAWNEFANRLGQRELPRLDHFLGGLAYRLPPPGALVEDGVLRANSPFPGLAIRYRADGQPPSADSALFTGPVAVSGEVRLATFDTRGRSSRETVVAAGN